MKHKYSLEGFLYKLRPVEFDDAQFIVNVRLEDAERNRFIHAVDADVSKQEEWIESYFNREGDYYFVIQNRLTGEKEGLISFYDEAEGVAEWGRWVIKKGSLAAPESVYLLYRIAFEQVGLRELYCRTVAANKAVVSFHESIGEKCRQVLPDFFELNGASEDAVEQYADRAMFYETITPKLMKQIPRVFLRAVKGLVGAFEFDHLGIATHGINKELPVYTLMGYMPRESFFIDENQGIAGLFLECEGKPTLELLENLPGSNTLDLQLSKGNKIYHLAFRVSNMDHAISMLKRNRARIISPCKQSVYFGKRICFMVFPTMLMVELIEL